MKKLFTAQKGFTLIELLVVIAIIAILTGIVTSNFASSRSRARDAKRISDLGNIQLALELYFDRCKQYPEPTIAAVQSGSSLAKHLVREAFASGGVSTVDTSADNCSAAGVTLASYIANIPRPPQGGYYDYAVDDPTKPTTYVLHTTLENYNDVFKDASLNTVPGSTLVCERGSNITYRNYCLGPQ